jgi:hypothetical protein
MSAREVTPWNPSRRATARVKNPLPAPTICPHCGGAVEIRTNDAVYNGRKYGEWPWIYICTGCWSYVGMHPYTSIPLGTLATGEIREARKQSKRAFCGYMIAEGINRRTAYTRLAKAMGLGLEQCHFGWFGVEQCRQAEAAIRRLATEEAIG